MRVTLALLSFACLAFGQTAVGPIELGKRWAGVEHKDVHRALSGYATLFVYWGAGPAYTTAAPALVDLTRRHADRRFRMIVTANANTDWKPLLGTLWTQGMAWRPHNVCYTYDGKHAHFKPPPAAPYFVLLDHTAKTVWHGPDLTKDRATIDKLIAQTPVFYVGSSFPKIQKTVNKVQAGKGFPKTLRIIDKQVKKKGPLSDDYFVVRALITGYRHDDLIRGLHMRVNAPADLKRYLKGMQLMYAGTSAEASVNDHARYLKRNSYKKATALHKELVRALAPVRKGKPCTECAGLGVTKCQLHCVTCRAKNAPAYEKARDRLQKVYRKHDFELRKAYADRGEFIEVIPEKDHPYPILIVMAEHIALLGGVK